MSWILRKQGERSINPVLENARHERRRRILGVLQDGDVVDEETVARHLVAAERGTAPSDVPDDAVRSVRVELVHAHLPALAEADLVAWDDDDGTVAAGTHPILDEPGFQRLLEREGASWDELLDCLADERRRTVVAVLRARGEATPRRALAHEVVAREEGGDPSAEAVESTLRSLHHVHLPKLEAAGVVEIDRDAGTVADADHPYLATSLFDRNSDEGPTSVPHWLARSSG